MEALARETLINKRQISINCMTNEWHDFECFLDDTPFIILRKSNKSFIIQLSLSLITEDNNLFEISNVSSSTKGPLLTAARACTDMLLYLHSGWKPLKKGNVFSEFLYVVSAMDGLSLPTAVAFFRLISCAIIMPFLFSLANEILYVIWFT